MRAVLIENPVAHKVTEARRRVVERALEATFKLERVSTERRGHAADIAREAVRSGAEAVITLGGDGTVNEAVNGLMTAGAGSDVCLGVLPGGGTNVLARVLGYPNDLVDATAHLIELVESDSTRRLRLARLQGQGTDGPFDRVFTFGAGLVLDAETVRRVEESGWRPRLGDGAFVIHGFRSFFALRREGEPALHIQTPGGPVEAWWAVISKTNPFTYFGKRGLKVAPLARQDGGLDVTAGRTAKVLRTLRWLQQVLSTGRHTRHKDVLYLHDQPRVTITATRPVTLQADGEHLGQVTRVEAEALPHTLRVWA
ncbi:MAG TPA: diacylglycerol kinase family protein [Actinomycetota bacterium]|nr:diacylglycerol kinase family protein [Actinomycetota bacterium]